MLYIGIDLGGTGIKAGIVDENGKIIVKDSCPTGAERGYGAVIHDMCRTLTRRFPNIEIRLFPVKVQGTGAAEDVARGVAYFNRLVQTAADWQQS